MDLPLEKLSKITSASLTNCFVFLSETQWLPSFLNENNISDLKDLSEIWGGSPIFKALKWRNGLLKGEVVQIYA